MSSWQVCWDSDGDGVVDSCTPIYVQIRRWPPEPPWHPDWLKDLFENRLTPVLVTPVEDPRPVHWIQDVVRLAGRAKIAETRVDR